MGQILDIVALRSLVAVADCGGFHRAAATLRISQSAVSQHVRRLEKTLGRPVVERQGRAAVFTPDGQALLGEARRILGAHDDALRRLIGPGRPTVTVGATEHAADLILPAVTAALPGHQVRFRIDRTRRLDAAVDRGVLDLAVHLAEASSVDGVPIGALPLSWYAASTWQPPSGPAVPLVAIEEPCVLRRRAVAALSAHGRDPYVVCDSGYVAGVFDAVRAGLGVALMATAASTPEGLTRRTDLPPVTPAPVSLRIRAGADPALAEAVREGLRAVLAPA
ncbi:LysR family transcriptional regulator [Actinoplanes cyaneus]|uniref:LysR family transcriptional regulator n=1 Tax=Actinoplanes cyaneus TaxID=52696 RepID=A0A919LXQ8_9ACTN|nr:LysR family transcriptional regulator [Actinoplanes cyaneus]MCW2142630.1 DNA-binding transcriptional regulator, LysR family [Actinoplanes cyaneus]GID62180.1 LysR family transcriptional regulator [Actinoplanes cyaneus]